MALPTVCRLLWGLRGTLLTSWTTFGLVSSKLQNRYHRLARNRNNNPIQSNLHSAPSAPATGGADKNLHLKPKLKISTPQQRRDFCC